MTTAPIADDARRQTSGALIDLLGRWFDPTPGHPDSAFPDDLLMVAMDTKTIGLLQPVTVDAPANANVRIAEARRAILFGNLRNLDWTVKAVAPLQQAGIDVIVIKGALRSHEVYGTWDARRSSDIDLLVRPGDYDRARRVMIADGLVAQVPDASVWWHRCLGESPYARSDGSSPIVDLHHSVQQPGGPYPANIDGFFTDSVARSIGPNAIRTLSAHHALLVCAINYGKAVRARKPWLAEIHEFTRSTRTMTRGGMAALLDDAKHQQLLRLVTECLDISDTLFPRSSFPRSSYAAPEREALALASIGIYPEMQFERLGHLWKWIDGAGPVRLARFGSGMLRIIQSEIALRREGLATPK